MDITILQNFIIAIALGALIGLEREYAQYKKKGHDYAGIRTFPLIALFGALCAYFADLYSVWMLFAGIFLTGILIIIAYFTINKQIKHYVGATTEIAGFLTFLIGALSYYGELVLAAVLAVVITVILYARSFLHNFTKKIKPEELRDTLKFAVVAFVILPFLPNQSYGPHGIFNPFVIWLMVVFISGISFVGYILMKWLGERGLTISALLGGLVSSTAVTTSFATRSVKQKTVFKALALGVILANSIMFARILVVTFVINQAVFWQVLFPIFFLLIVSLIGSFFVWKKSAKIKGKIDLGSPFTLKPALKFGIFFAVILALVKLAEVYLSTKGVYVVSLISGFADVDAITVSLSQLAKSSLPLLTARNGILIAALTNVAVKGGIAYWFGGKEFGRLVIGAFSVLIVFGVLFLVFF